MGVPVFLSFLRRLGPVAAISATLLAAGVPAGSVAPGQRPEQRQAATPPAERPFLDVREDAAAREAPDTRAQDALRSALGVHGVVDVDPLTGTPRVVARLDGFLTDPSDRDAVDVVLDYVQANEAVFRLDEGDLAGLRLVRDYVDFRGVRHIVWAQTAGGIPLFGHDLRASVTADGRLVNVLGSPLPDLELPDGGPSLDGGPAVAAALRDVGRPVAAPPRTLAAARGAARTTRFAGGHRAGLVLFHDGRSVRLAWHVTADADGDEVYSSLVDADSGAVLRRANKVERDGGWIFDYYPDAPTGGTERFVDFTAQGWLDGSGTLNGSNAYVFMDLNDDNKVTTTGTSAPWGSENAPPMANGLPADFDRFEHADGYCSPDFLSTCSWNSFDPGTGFPDPPSWYDNRLQDARQVFYFVNTFHEWLEQPPIGFDAASGNFEGSDKVVAHANDGANTGQAGVFIGENMPDGNHVNNANMLTLPDGSPPRMQMYLFTSFGPGDPTPDTNGGDDAAVVYHEYAHGLSNRLVTDAEGWGALDAFHSGAMGEGWSDWYAMDYLVEQGFAPDTVAAGEVTLDRYLGNGEPTIRTEGLDCPVAPASAECPGGEDTGAEGGYTFGDMGRISPGGAEVHADGEIWAQTLWDLRGAVGAATARGLVTDAMRVSPTNPSFLDMRNAILQADLAANGGANEDTIWQVFAERGMGYFAAVGHANDTSPVESFATPPDPADGTGSLTGVVIDADTGARLSGVQVAFPYLDLVGTTDALGQYSIPNVPVATYPRVVATRSVYSRFVMENVPIAEETEYVLNVQLRRNWAVYGGSGRVSTFTGPNFSGYGCGPTQAIDGSSLTGWSTEGNARSITVKLPKYVDVTGFAIDPGAVCGDPDSASLKGYRVHVSPTGASGSWTTVKSSSFLLADAHRLNTVTIAKRRGIRYVRLTALSNHSGGAYPYVDVAEFEVFGPTSLLCLGVGATRVGTGGRNTLNGTSGRDVIVGLGGGDRIDGRGGNDVICAGSGADVLIGGAGVDKFDGGSGNDTIFSRDRKKELTVRGGTGRDRVRRDRVDRTTSVERSF